MTIGLSPKALLAFLFPLIAAAGGALASWVTTGDFNDAEIRTAVGGLVTSGLALLGAYIGQPGPTAERFEVASDDLLSDEAKAQLA